MNGIDAVVLQLEMIFALSKPGFMPTPQNQVNTLVYHSNRARIF
jgi:hypothetical protein